MLFVWTSYQLYCGRITPCCHKKWNGYIVFFSCNIMYFVIGIMQRVFSKFDFLWYVFLCICVYVFFVYICCCVFIVSASDQKSKVILFVLFLKTSVFVNYAYVDVFQRLIQNPVKYPRWSFSQKHLTPFSANSFDMVLNTPLYCYLMEFLNSCPRASAKSKHWY